MVGTPRIRYIAAMARTPLLLAILLAGCGHGESSTNASIAWSNRQVATPPIEGTICEGPIAPSSYPACDFGSPTAMRGVWISGFERSAFIEDATTIPTDDSDRVWLAFADDAPPDPALRAALDNLRATGAAMIDIVGRRSRNGRVILVDRFVSGRLLGPVPTRR